jgi:iron complex outermembrane receptor protein
LVGTAVRRALLAAAITAGGALPTSVALAQEASTKDQAMEEVVVTGSILRRTDAETPSPVTVLSAETLEERGINTVSEAIQRLSANNAGTIQQGWNTGFNFASGANAPALRGLTVQSTLSVADGLRIAPYPLADDGQRNFVDLNTVPSAIVERIEVLRDGASSTYGADAIAGVVNVITKKEIQGLHFGGSTAISQDGGGDENRFDLTWGYGDLESQGYNFYVSAEYQKQDPLWARERGYPFNTQDLQRICGPSGSCMTNLNWNGVTAETGAFNGLFSIPGVALARPITTAAGVAGAGRYQYVNPTAGCREWPTISITAA